jgi:hypothetical protein
MAGADERRAIVKANTASPHSGCRERGRQGGGEGVFGRRVGGPTLFTRARTAAARAVTGAMWAKFDGLPESRADSQRLAQHEGQHPLLSGENPFAPLSQRSLNQTVIHVAPNKSAYI